MSEFTICGYMTEQPLIFPHPAPMPMYNIETTILGFAVQTSAAITRLEFVFSKKLDPLHRQKIFVVYNLLCLHVLYSESTCMVLFSLVGTPKITRGSATHLWFFPLPHSWILFRLSIHCTVIPHYCLTDLSYLWTVMILLCLFQESKNIIFTCGDSLVAFATMHSWKLSFHCTVILHYPWALY
jgi:hypothetical protein